MAYEFKLPDIGEGLVEGEIVKWLVAAGDTVEEDQPMVEVLTDKATVELPAPTAGTVSELKADEGEVVPVGQVIIVIDDGAGEAPAKEEKKEKEPEKETEKEKEKEKEKEEPEPAKEEKEPEPEPKREREPERKPEPKAGERKRVLATPATRKLARERDVDITQVRGTGPRGRVTKEDVESFAERGAEAAPAAAPSAETPEDRRVPVRGLRRLISQSMARSKGTAAHFTLVEEVHCDELVRLRGALKEEAEREGAKLTYLPFVMKALVPVLREFPFMNSQMDDDAQEIVLKGGINLGFATDTEAGLTVPVIHDVPNKSVLELAKEIEQAAARAREGRSTQEDVSGGTFTITSTGRQGGLLATPVINHPEVAILGVHAIKKKPVVRDDEIVVGHVMNLSLSLDHRVVDGMTGARFLNRLIEILSEPGRLLLSLR